MLSNFPPVYYIYVLKCEKGKFYIGKTKDQNLLSRIVAHALEYGSEWTKKYTPLDVVEVIKNCNGFHEDMYTKMYMAKYGIENVRGGTYTTIEIEPETIEFLEDELAGAQDLCLRCGNSGHFIADCYAIWHVKGYRL